MQVSMERELKLTTQDKAKFVAEFSEEDYDYIVNGWQVSENSKTSLPQTPSIPKRIEDATQ